MVNVFPILIFGIELIARLKKTRFTNDGQFFFVVALGSSCWLQLVFETVVILTNVK